MFVFAFALGIAVTALWLSALEFSRGDFARFFGAFLGSLITLSGAISLYYLKEKEADQKKVDDFVDLLDGARVFSESCKADFENPDFAGSLPLSLSNAEGMWGRVMRFGRHHEFDVYKIGHALHLLEIGEDALEDFNDLDDFDDQLTKDTVAGLLGVRIEIVADAQEELRAKSSRKSS